MDTRSARLVAEYKHQRDALLASFPELAEDAETLADTLEGISDLPDAIDRLMHQHREDKAFAKALDDIIGETRERKERLARRADKAKAAALALLEAAGEKKMQRPDYTASVSFSKPGVVITDEAAIPPDYCTTVVTPSKKKIRDALNNGEQVPGAVLGNGGIPTMSVRWK